MTLRSLSVLLPLLAGCAADMGNPRTVDLADDAFDAHPLAPGILRDVALIDDDVSFTHPYVPGHRTSMDGRVALRVQGGPPGSERLATTLSFFLLVPERLEEPILSGPNGAQILGETTPFDVVFPPALDPDVSRLGHHALCDPTQPFAVAGERPNPYACGPDTRHDCYDITVISSTSPAFGATMWGTPATVEVEDPKTSDARIVAVTLGEPVEGAYIPASTEFTEPSVTVDGRLLTGRLGRFPRSWTNPETGETMIRPYDLAYALLPDDADPCDITGWTDFHPMSHAPHDPRMVANYGLAAYPFRDTEGNPIPDGEDMGGTYPWIDREGANVFMTGVHGRLVEQSEARYPRRCAVSGCEQFTEQVDFDRGYLVAGLWTHGKLVHLDGLINAMDWAVGVSPDAHWEVDLYRDEADAPVPVRFGSGRFIDEKRATEGPYPPGYTHNANILDSVQNLLNHRAEARPITPRDVVWIMSSGVATDEIAFDDFLDPNALIVANMQASITQIYDDTGSSTSIPRQHNGQVRELLGMGVLSVYVLDPEADEPIHLQNAATSLAWQVPPYGWVEAGTSRVEPVALGGIDGRGFWLSGDAAIRYAMPDNDKIDDQDSYLGLYVDPRTAAGEARTLLSFPDETGVVFSGDAVQYVVRDRILHEVMLPQRDGWVHLGFRLRGGHRDVTLLLDGYPVDHFKTAKPLFSLGRGTLVVGRSGASWTGVRGWVDDFVVLAHDVNPEVACNHAGGTLIEVLDNPTWTEVASAYPRWAHEALSARVGASAEARFACMVDYTTDYGAHLGSVPPGTRGIRDTVNFPEGPLRAGVPRPDSTANDFCLSCHHEAGQGGLSLEALVFQADTMLEHDARRQPTQPPRRVFGNIPAGWIPEGQGPGSPTEALQAPPEGALIDLWVLPDGGGG